MSKVILTSALLFAGLSSMRAGIIFSNIGAGYPADSNTGLGANAGYFGTSFIAGASGTLGEVEFAVYEANPLALTAGLYTSSANQPGTLLESWNVSVPTSRFTLTTLTSVLNPVLSQGSEYWLVVSGPAETNLLWVANDSDTLGGDDIGVTLTSMIGYYPEEPGPGLALLTSAPVSQAPEPAAASLAGFGLLALSFWRARRTGWR
jgi:hypothetical protein